jgi:hypothetical protein
MPHTLPAGTVGGIASMRVAGAAPSQSTPVPEAAETTATAGTAAQSTGFTHDQVLDLFVRYFKRPGPPQGTIVLHPTQASYEAAEQAAGYRPGETLGFFNVHQELVHLPPTVSDLTAMHEALHMIGRQSGVYEVLGRYVEEGLTEWLARSLGPVAERRAYDGNVAFVRLLANIVGEETLRDAYLHRLWAPLRSALRARLGSEAAVQHLYHQLKQVGPQGENGRVLQGVFDMLWPGSSAAPESLTTTAPAPVARTGSAVIASVRATQGPEGPGGGGSGGRRGVPLPPSGRQLQPVMELDDAIELGRALVNSSVWLQEIRRISGLEQTRRVGEIRDFIKIYSRHSGTTLDVIPADQASSYQIGPRNWGTYLFDENRIVMHEGIFTTPGVNPIREVGHEVGAAELRRVYNLPKDYIPRVVDIRVDMRNRMGGDSLTHVIDTLIKAPD